MNSRAFDTRLHLDAPIDRVWQALTDAPTLVQWFATDATIEASPGGRYDISWHGDWPWSMRVVECDAPRRLVLSDTKARPFDTNGRPLAEAAPVELVLEFHLASEAGGTTLRLVHSGFGQGANWDDELEGVTHGWQTELQVLKHYLERCFTRQRGMAWARTSIDASPDEAWTRMTGALLEQPSALDGAPGTAVSLAFTTGDRVDGTIVFGIPRRHAVVRTTDDQLLHVTMHRAAGRTLLQVVRQSWRWPDDGLEGFGQRVQSCLNQLEAMA